MGLWGNILDNIKSFAFNEEPVNEIKIKQPAKIEQPAKEIHEKIEQPAKEMHGKGQRLHISLSIDNINLSFGAVFKLLFYITISAILIGAILYFIFGTAIVGFLAILKAASSQ